MLGKYLEEREGKCEKRTAGGGGGGGVRESQKRGFSRYTFPFSKPLQ